MFLQGAVVAWDSWCRAHPCFLRETGGGGGSVALRGAAWGWNRLWTLSSYWTEVDARRVEGKDFWACRKGRCRMWEARNSSTDRLVARATSLWNRCRRCCCCLEKVVTAGVTAVARFPPLVVKDTDGGSRWLVPNIAGKGCAWKAPGVSRGPGLVEWGRPVCVVWEGTIRLRLDLGRHNLHGLGSKCYVDLRGHKARRKDKAWCA